MAAPSQFVGDAPVSVAGKLVSDIADERNEPVIGKLRLMSVGSIVVGAAR
jgi:hypothetical protein